MSTLTDRILDLPVHSIYGYEWECAECHTHFQNHECWMGHGVSPRDEDVDTRGNRSTHDRLVDLELVLRAIAEAAK